MGRKKGASHKQGAHMGGGGGEGWAEVDPQEVYFAHSRIRPVFSCGRRVEDTLSDVLEGRLELAQLPLICVMPPQGAAAGPPWFSLNNRRLWVLKELRARGAITTARVRVRPQPDTRRDRGRYCVERCSLQATLMRGAEAREAGADGDACSDSGSAGSAAGAPADPVPAAADAAAPPAAAEAAADPPVGWPPAGWTGRHGGVELHDVDVNSLAPRKWVRDGAVALAAAHAAASAGDSGAALHPSGALDALCGGAPPPEPLLGRLTARTALLLAPLSDTQDAGGGTVSGSHWSLLCFLRGHGWLHADGRAGRNDARAAALAAALDPLLCDGGSAGAPSALPMPPQQGRGEADSGMWAAAAMRWAAAAAAAAAAQGPLPPPPAAVDPAAERLELRRLAWRLCGAQ